MAAVTLKDLMDPLSKIAAAAEATNEKLDAFVAMATGATGGAGLEQAIYTQLETQTTYLKLIYENTKGRGLGGIFSGKSSKKEVSSAGKTLEALGLGAKATAQGMLLWMLVPSKAVNKFIDFVTRTYEVLAEQDQKKVKEGVNILDMMGGAIKSFALGLAVSALVIIPSMIAIPFLTVSIAAMGLVFTLLGKRGKDIKKGAKAVDRMGDSMKSFAIGLVFFALTSMIILTQPKILSAMVGTLVLVGGAFAILGLVDKSIKKGAVALFVMGASLVLFSVGYLFFAAVAKDTKIEDIFIQAGILVGTGLAFAILGKLFGQILPGAIAVAAMGVGLLAFGLGYLPFAAVTKDMTLDSVAKQAGILLALGLEFAAAGLASPFIIAGASAFAAVGIALLLLAPGLSAMKKLDFTQEDSVNLATILSAVKSAFLGGKDADEGFFSKIGGAITGAVDSVRMIEAAAGFIAAGIALKTLAWGLNAFKEIKWNDELSKELVTMLNGVTTAFALAGSNEQVPSSSFFGQMFGFKRTAVEEGINSVLGAGKALKNIAKGLQAFQELVDSGVNFGTPDRLGRYEKGTLGYAVTNTIGFINEAFAAVADQGNVEAGGIFGSLFKIKKNKVAEGIDSVKGAGKELTNIVNGLKTFQDLVDKDIDWDTLGNTIKKSITFVGEAFASIGSGENEQEDGWFIFKWDENKIAKGIDAVSGAGKELTNIVNGLKTFQDLVDKDIDWDTLGNTIKKSITFVGEAFASIGSGENEQEDGWFIFKWDENKIAKGIDAVSGAGKELTNIAQGLVKFKELKDPEKVAKGIESIFTSIGDTFTHYYEKEEFKNDLDHMRGFITELSMNAEKGYLEKAADGMEKIAAAINKIDPYKAEVFSKLFSSAGTLSSNRRAQKELIEAIKEIKDILKDESGEGGGGVLSGLNNIGDTGGGDRGEDRGSSDARLNATLSRIDSTLSRLPSQIQAIKIEVSPDYN